MSAGAIVVLVLVSAAGGVLGGWAVLIALGRSLYIRAVRGPQ